MRNSIRYYYEIEVDDLSYRDGSYYFDSYILIEHKKEIDMSIYKYLKEGRYPIYEVVWNKESKHITTIEEKEYILLKKTTDIVVTFSVLEQFLIPANKKDALPWHQLWMDKIDYYEKHMQTVNFPKLKECFFYYAGLTENAISFYKLVKQDWPLYISHLRLNRKEDFSNPMNFALDYKARDVAEYAKKLFFEDRLNMDDLFLFFYRNQFHEFDYVLVYARLLYPSYYFDCYDNIINGGNEESINIIIDRIDAYEEFLRTFYIRIKQYATIPKIDWLIDK